MRCRSARWTAYCQPIFLRIGMVPRSTPVCHRRRLIEAQETAASLNSGGPSPKTCDSQGKCSLSTNFITLRPAAKQNKYNLTGKKTYRRNISGATCITTAPAR